MTVLPLVLYPDPRLMQMSSAVEEVTDEARAFLDDMLETMYATNGIGLSAVQVGVMKRIVTMDIHHGSDRYPDKTSDNEHSPYFMVNPEVIEHTEETYVFEEGCLSFPGQYGDVTRPKEVTVRYLDYHGVEQITHFTGLEAVCVQHEIDHLNGVVFIDYLSKLKKDMIARRMKKISKK